MSDEDKSELNKIPDSTQAPNLLNPDTTATTQEPIDNDWLADGRFLLDEKGDWAAERTKLKAKLDKVRWHHQDFLPAKDNLQQRVREIKAAENSILEAAQPILRAISELPANMGIYEYTNMLGQYMRKEIELFTIACDEADLPWKKVAIVRYCLCTAFDEMANTSFGMYWAQNLLLNYFENDSDGGNKFFLLIGRLTMDPHEYIDVLEVMLRILGLGYEGRYSIIDGGDRQLTRIKQRLLTIIQSNRDPSAQSLSPHALQPAVPVASERFVIPVRVSLILSCLFIGSSYIWCKYHLSLQSQQIINTMKLVNVKMPVIESKIKKQRLNLTILLKNEIAQNLLTVDENSSQSHVTLKGDSWFNTGAITIHPKLEPLINRIVQAVKEVNGSVLIVGHTDAIPIHRKTIANNQILSEKRAATIGNYFLAAGFPQQRVTIVGKGDTQPLSSNATAEGRAENRRVEFFVTYGKE